MRNVLREAAEEGDLKLVELLLDRGADVNMKTEVRSAHVSERFLFIPYVQLIIVQEMASMNTGGFRQRILPIAGLSIDLVQISSIQN